MNKFSTCVVLAALSVLSGCHTTYYVYEHGVGGNPNTWTISAGRDTGPSGDSIDFVHPEVVAELCAQPESGMNVYYRMMLVHAFHGGAYKSQASAELQKLLPVVNATASQDEIKAINTITTGEGTVEDLVHGGTAFARAAGLLIAPYLIQSMSDYGYARWTWGQRIEEDLSGFNMLGNGLRMTAHRDQGLVKLYATPAHGGMFAQPTIVLMDVAVAEDEVIWIPHDEDGNPLPTGSDANLVDTCAKVRELTPEDWEGVKRIER